jgi:hypothetical protein
MTTILQAQPIPALGEIAILKERQATLLQQLATFDLKEANPLPIFDELAEIETALQRYGGYDMALDGYQTGMETRRDLGI